MLDKTYRPSEVENRIYDSWERKGYFRPSGKPGAPTFCIALPPPNVTGSLHMGHALDHTIQDVLIRFHRMRGFNTLWQPGTDHAGIATQMVVERELAKSGTNLSRREIGREAFVERVWNWKSQSGGTIVRQMRRLGQSADWSRERFTMDDGLSAAVRRAFVTLYREGLIYRDKRLVNWDCQLQTAVSDIEVQQTEVDGKLWYLNYPIIELPGTYVTVATTRPETMLGDSGVAVHPDDERYRDLIGLHVDLPLVGRRIPIVADAYSDPEKGTGAVKITPAHDFNDFEVGRRHKLELIPILDGMGRVNENGPDNYRDLDRFEARKRIVQDLDELGLLVKIERHRHVVPHGDRSGTPLEPYLTDQWYCDAAKLAVEAIAAVEDGRTVFVPRAWENTYFEWMRNIQPWCISRQLWWGHQIPAWFAPDGQIFVAESEEEAFAEARRQLGPDVKLKRDEDVLDTWFSSGLWPFSTLGWPEQTAELAQFYPTNVLVTGFDIIFFWVARMMMLGLKFTRQVPFRTVYMHGLVRDERGQKMSKTRGNVVDPLELADEFGADALRLALLASTVQGRDVNFAPSRVEGYRNFVTKLWNAARFLELNGAKLNEQVDLTANQSAINRWIVGETMEMVDKVTASISDYRFNDATLSLYHFVWDTFCDWYVELAKPLLAGDNDEIKAETRATASWVLALTLRCMHPFAPYVTEELWDRLFGAPGGMLIQSEWPSASASLVDPEASRELNWVVRLVSAIRSARTEMNVPAGARLRLLAIGTDEKTRLWLEANQDAIFRLARIESIEANVQILPERALVVVVDDASFALPVGDVVDLDRERSRLAKEKEKLVIEITKLKGRLANEGFLAKASADTIEEQRRRLDDMQATFERLSEAERRIA
ncbi:valyl-tRNA synthetase [Arboricoccus pini]|uniref:Valine--tRNA ligase n=1 Tax=Arboricoccus pini TaxID=1963835 RepID=A0A212R4Y7_9PROT|nr:valine--tRNA ligase [Arboricoccus pini]SNB67107.1 valyl-tRNA synthetase [Arboricoccus pini]